jgi:hypothetical protein
MEEKYRQNLKEGKYKTISEKNVFLEALTLDGQKISKDLHFKVLPASVDIISDKSSKDDLKKLLPRVKSNNYYFQKVERLLGNIGYLKIDQFVNPKYGRAGDTATAAMNFLANSDAVIIDLRDNVGGSPFMVKYLLGYFFSEETHADTTYTRYNKTTKQGWIPGYVNGPKLIDIPLYVLQSKYSASGAEDFSYNVKAYKKGKIIGEISKGMANPVEIKHYPDQGIIIILPVSYTSSSVTGTSWEGVGVKPDYEVSADQALIQAQLLAYEEILKKTDDDLRKMSINWSKKALSVQLKPIELSLNEFKIYTGQYGPRRIYIESGNLYYQRESVPPYKLTPLGNDEFLVENLDYFRLSFNRDKNGNIDKLIGNYFYSGQFYSDENPKNK